VSVAALRAPLYVPHLLVGAAAGLVGAVLLVLLVPPALVWVLVRAVERRVRPATRHPDAPERRPSVGSRAP
jgi:hypothetical protein